MSDQFIVFLTLLSIILSAISFTVIIPACIFAFLAYTEVLAYKKSTHKIEWVPVDPEAPLSKNEKKEVQQIHEFIHGDDEE